MTIGIRIGGPTYVEPKDIFVVERNNLMLRLAVVRVDTYKYALLDLDTAAVVMHIEGVQVSEESVKRRIADKYDIPVDEISYRDCRFGNIKLGYTTEGIRSAMTAACNAVAMQIDDEIESAGAILGITESALTLLFGK